MFSRKSLSQFGLIDVPNGFDPVEGLNDDSDLEVELAAINSEESSDKTLKKPAAKLLPESDLKKLLAESLKDVEYDSVDSDELENDTDLLCELQQVISDFENPKAEGAKEMNTNFSELGQLSSDHLCSIDTIKQRIQTYEIALANAKLSRELPKIRRLNRGLNSLNKLLMQSKSGKIIDPSEIPPEVSISSPVSDDMRQLDERETDRTDSEEPNCSSAATVVLSNADKNEEAKHPLARTVESNHLVQQLRSRQTEYKAAALKSKHLGDNAMALQYVKVFKQFDVVVKMIEDGQNVDLSDMPPPPEQFKKFMERMISTIKTENTEAPATELEANKKDNVDILDTLKQRLDKYRSVQNSAEAEENPSKARRFGRIVKQYEEAINAYKSGRPVRYEELPTPPGFEKLSVENAGEQSVASTDPQSATPHSILKDITKSQDSQHQPTNRPRKDLTTRTCGNHQKSNLAEQQMKILVDRQKEFKIAALEAKRAGEIEQAKEYLKIFKGFDALLNAASSGLPVDLSTLPVPPGQRDCLEDSFAIISSQDCDPHDEISDIGVRIEEQLSKQLMMCKNTRDHHKAMGDIAGTNRFENLALAVQKDLDLVRYSKRKGIPIPKFHYEQRSFNIVHCNTELTENELEITVARGISYNVPNPKEIDTYVKIEFPLPQGDVFKARTNLIKDSDSPEYGQHFKVAIVRGNRQFQRIFKRHAAKFEVCSRGGFLRSDIVIGVVNVKLQPLETKCEIHDSFDLFEGRKKVGGKLEIKIRVRNPILTKQIEHINEKWLVIDS